MSNVYKLDSGVDKPAQKALSDAIDAVIEEFGNGTLTPVDILGVLEFTKIKFYNDQFFDVID